MQPIYSTPSGIASGLTSLRVAALLDGARCESIRAQAEQAGFAPTARDYPDGYRNNDRLVRDDPALAAELFGRLASALPTELRTPDGARWKPVGLNPRFRYCRYRDGQGFCIHRDGAFARSPDERTLLTCQVYLNDAAEFAGGATRFYEASDGAHELGRIRPEAGMAIVFDHALWHDGEPVTLGTKWVMRTDVICRRVDVAAAIDPARVLAGHEGYVWSVIRLDDGSLATASRDKTVRLWRQDGAGFQCASILRGHDASVVALAQRGDGRLVSASRDHTVRVWSGDRADIAWMHDGAVLALLRLADGRVASSGSDGTVRIDGRVVASLGSWVWSLAEHEGALVAATEDGRVVTTGQSETRFDAPVRSVASCHGALVAGLADGRVVRSRVTAQVHRGAITAVASFDDGRIATASEDGSVCVLDANLAALARFRHRDIVRAVVPLPDGRLASAGFDGVVRLWSLPQMKRAGPARDPARETAKAKATPPSRPRP